MFTKEFWDAADEAADEERKKMSKDSVYETWFSAFYALVLKTCKKRIESSPEIETYFNEHLTPLEALAEYILFMKAKEETDYLESIPGMKESIQEGLNTPIEECDTELDWEKELTDGETYKQLVKLEDSDPSGFKDFLQHYYTKGYLTEIDCEWGEEVAVVKQPRYQSQSGEDLIDRWAREETPEIFRAKMFAHIEAYEARYGKKDKPLSEAKKIQDFANRLVQYEEKYGT